MVAAELPTNASLAALLSARARRTPLDRLALDVIGGVLVAAAALWARPSGWVVIAAAAGCFASYGVWALAEVRLLPQAEPVPHEDVWEAVQGAAAVIGIGAFALLLFAAVGLALGPIIS